MGLDFIILAIVMSHLLWHEFKDNEKDQDELDEYGLGGSDE